MSKKTRHKWRCYEDLKYLPPHLSRNRTIPFPMHSRMVPETGMPASWLVVLESLILAYMVYWLGLVVYRVWFHPLSGFPGPLLAAATGWWEFWYDVVKDGELVLQLPRLHEKYGPAVRINPRELHINDPAFFSEVYKQNTKFHKDPTFYDTLGFPTASVCITSPTAHRTRREILNPFFSKRTITSLSSVLHSVIEKLCANIALRPKGVAIPLQDAFHCMTVDIISGYAFGESFNMLDEKDFNSAHVRAVERSAEMQWTIKHFPWIRWLEGWMPRCIGMDGGLVQLAGTCEGIVRKLLESDATRTRDEREYATVFDALLNPNASSKGHVVPDYQELVDEAIIILAAGTETTAIALTYATYHIINNPEVKAKVLKELSSVERGVDGRMPYQVVENLPYLSAVIKETLRLNHAVPGRMPRIVPPGGAYVPSTNQFVPAGTCVGVSHYMIHSNPEIFPSPHEFCPERWIDQEGRGLDKWLVSFSKGSRGCLGINLAYAELYLTLATLFTRFDMELFETGEKEMRWKDHGVTHTVGHLKVLARPIAS